MYIPLNPFRISDIFSLSKTVSFSGTSWKSKESDRVIPFSRGRWVLRELGSSIIRNRKKSRGTVFIPEYFCEISLTPLRSPEFDIHFYKITPELEPDITDLERMTREFGPPDMLLFVHYFGIPLDMSATEAWCRENNVLLMEDAAHSLLPVPGIGNHGCPVIYTPWKFLNSPEGALLVLPEESEIPFTGLEYDKPDPWWWVRKRFASTVATGLHRFRPIHVKQDDDSEAPIDPGRPQCNALSANFLSSKEKDILSISRAREQNYRQIDEAIADSHARDNRIFCDLPAHFAPYVYPLRITGNRCYNIMVALNQIRIPAQPWSDLSPEVKDSREYPLSNALRREVMVLPVHQDLTPSQVEWMAREVIRHISKH